LKNIYLIH